MAEQKQIPYQMEIDKTAVVVFTNSDDGDPLMYMEKVYQWVIPALALRSTP